MTLNYEALRGWRIGPIRQQYGARDTIMYNLGVGAGVIDTAADADLTLLWERELRSVPTMATVLGVESFWLDDPRLGLDWHHLVHGEHSITWHAPIPTEGDVTSHFSVEEIYDKGAGRGALLEIKRRLLCNLTGAALATIRQRVLLRKDGGFGGSASAPKPRPVPGGAPDFRRSMRTRPEQALLYRLSGDHFQIHIDPVFARNAGLPGPVLHGLCTYGIACRVAVDTLCQGDGDRLRRLDVRFSAPVIPGDEIDMRIWRLGSNEASYQCWVDDRLVLDNGYICFD